MQIFDWSFALKILPILLRAAVITVEATVIGFFLAAVIGLLLALLRRSGPKFVQGAVIAFVEFVRSTPILVQVFFIFFLGPRVGLTLSPFVAGMIALGIHYGCLLSEVYRAGFDAVPKGQWEAPVALNLSRARAYRDIILPQAIPPMVPMLGNYFVSMFKDTPLLSSIGVIEMMSRAKLIGSETFRYLEPISMVGLFFLVMSLSAAAAINAVERWLNTRYGRGAS